MDITSLLKERELLLLKKKAAQRSCDIPLAQHYATLLEQIDRTLTSIRKAGNNDSKL